ncbi:MAG: formamidopyrimidine-DNA glycosylase [Planctomycetota bacterium]|nr:formamidopyrimidine-DNA glycosylase [Planctomycetota bacterium]
MPELPEVETMRRSLFASIGMAIVSVHQPTSRYRPIKMEPCIEQLQERIVNRSVVAVERLGKRVVVCLDDDSQVLFQPKMAGLVLMDTPPNESHLRLVVGLALPDSALQASKSCVTSQILYWDQRGLGTIQHWTAEQMKGFLDSGVLGPDALDVDFETFYARFSDAFRPVKPTLLDQSRVAGIGNLYASEILHRSGVHPARRCDRLSKPAWKRIFESTRTILLEAIEHEGSTLSDGTYRKSKDDPGGYQNSHRVYDRADLRCLTCGQHLIVRIVQSQRSTFFCKGCQKR